MLKVGEIINTVKGIVETKIEMVKTEAKDQFIGLMARIILLAVIGVMSFVVLLFFSLSLAFYLSQITQPYMGFLLVGLIYLLIVIVLILVRNTKRFQPDNQNILKEFIFSSKHKNPKEDE